MFVLRYFFQLAAAAQITCYINLIYTFLPAAQSVGNQTIFISIMWHNEYHDSMSILHIQIKKTVIIIYSISIRLSALIVDLKDPN